MTLDEQLLVKSLIAVLEKKASTMAEAMEEIAPDEYDYYEGLADAYGIAASLVGNVLQPYLDAEELNDEPILDSVE